MFLSRIFHDRIINKLRQEAKLINELETKFSSLSVAQLAKETAKLKEKIQKGEVSPDDVLPEAFALAREAAKRTLGLRHYDVQLMGGRQDAGRDPADVFQRAFRQGRAYCDGERLSGPARRGVDGAGLSRFRLKCWVYCS